MIIKVCGLTQAENIREVEEMHPDMMGFICWEGSPRNVAHVPDYLPQESVRVGVFVNPSLQYLREQVDRLGLQRLQLHGTETQAFCRAAAQTTGLPVIKAIPISSVEDLEYSREYAYEPSVDLLLFDTRCPGGGGSGQKFDWQILQAYQGQKPFLLAGGIGPDSEAQVRSLSHPRLAGIDLNSRFETVPGIKDVPLLTTYIQNIRQT